MKHSLLYDWLCNISQFILGGAVKLAEEQCDLLSDLRNDDGVCRAAPGFDGCAEKTQKQSEPSLQISF